MAPIVATAPVDRQHRLSDLQPGMAKVHTTALRIPDVDVWRAAVGQAIETTRLLAKLSLKEFAAVIERDERQVARWIAGTDRPQFDALFAAEALRQPLLIAFAELAGPSVDIETHITVRRRGWVRGSARGRAEGRDEQLGASARGE